MTELLIVSLDGLSWDIVDALVAEGRMPNLAAVAESGVDLDLVSTVPPDSGPAWTSFQTGLAPETHGIIDFTRIDENYETQVNNLSSTNSDHLWGVLNGAGTEAIPINLPMLYPVRGQAPVAVSGLPAAQIDEMSVHPPDTLREIQAKYPDFKVVPGSIGEYTEANISQWLTDAQRTVDAKFEFARAVQSERDPDVLMLHVHETDVVQHKLWDRLHPPTEQVADFYANVDDWLGTVKDDADNIVIMSDHGFRDNEYAVYLNTWLRRKGYLRGETKSRAVSALKRFATAVLPEQLVGFYRRTDMVVEDRVLDGDLQQGIFGSSETTAFAHGVGRGKIYVKDWDMAEELVAELEAITVDGEQIVEDVTVYEDIDGPNLIVEPVEPYHFESALGRPTLVEQIEKKDGNHLGTHAREGIFVAHGDSIRDADRSAIDIVDVMPTILEAVDVPVPGGLDGEPQREVLS